ncbi:MAG: RNA-binding protein [Bacillota bacterium]|nr:RNA-binding protein [Bacillota bacterium]
MKDLTVQLGRVVLSKAGRDRGRYFIICGLIDEAHVMIADGSQRRLKAPKKKKLKHLDLKPEVLEQIKEKLESGKKVFDSEVYSALQGLGYQGKELD